MVVYPHPDDRLMVFQMRLQTDMASAFPSFPTDVSFGNWTLQCSAARPINTALAGASCGDWTTQYNSEVDLLATGVLSGEVDSYPYNRLDIATIVPPGPYLAGAATTLVDLLPQINVASKAAMDLLLPTDVQNLPIPQCDCSCGPIGMNLTIDPNNLLFFGSTEIYVTTQKVTLASVLLQPFIAPFTLPTLRP